jgi:TonB family protein
MQTHQKVFWSIFLGFVVVVLILVLSMDGDEATGPGDLATEGTPALTEEGISTPDTTVGETQPADTPVEEAEETSSPQTGESEEEEATPEAEGRRRIPPEGPRQPQWDAEAIQRVVNSHNAAIQDCYQQQLKKLPELRGRVIVRITIHPDGYVTDAEIVGASMRDNTVLECILRRIRNWGDFDPVEPSQGVITIRQTYRFGI